MISPLLRKRCWPVWIILATDMRVVMRGGGDLATGVICRLHRAGFSILVLELPQPRALRRSVSAAQAVFVGSHEVEGVMFEKVTVPSIEMLPENTVPVMVDPNGVSLTHFRPHVLVDARMKKRNVDCDCGMAEFVVGLGPGFRVGENCHAVVETQRGHTLGRVYWNGGDAALPDTGVATVVSGYGDERVLRSPCVGVLESKFDIGDWLPEGQAAASVNGRDIAAPFAGLLRGLMHSGLTVSANEKVGDIDPRDVRQNCFTISDKALAIGGGVLEAIFVWMRQRGFVVQ